MIPDTTTIVELTPEQKTIFREWIDKLRSGKYTQGKNYLRSPTDQYCCLGVLCEMFRVAHPDDDSLTWQLRLHDQKAFEFLGSTTMPNGAVLEWAGLSDTFARTLSFLNDTGATFEQIAYRLEQYLQTE